MNTARAKLLRDSPLLISRLVCLRQLGSSSQSSVNKVRASRSIHAMPRAPRSAAARLHACAARGLMLRDGTKFLSFAIPLGAYQPPPPAAASGGGGAATSAPISGDGSGSRWKGIAPTMRPVAKLIRG